MTDGVDRTRVCGVDDLLPGERTLVDIDDTVVCVMQIEDEYYAIENECAHQGGPLCKGKVQPELIGEFTEPGERITERPGDRLVVACPWHGWEYDLETGVHLGVDDIAIETYDVVVDNEVVYVEKSASSPDDQ